MSYARGITLALLILTPSCAGLEKVDGVDEYIATSMRRQHIVGLSAVVIHDGDIVKSRGYGLANLESRVPAGPETVYELASATKPLLATAIMLLVEDGEVRLEDEISRYVEGAPDAWKGITLRHLLTHTSGIKDYLADLRQDFPYHAPAEAIVEAAMAAPLNFAAGEEWSYSNTGYVLLGLVVRKVSGESYDGFLERRVFSVLDMASTRRDSPDEVVSDRAVGYLWLGRAGGLRNAEFLKYMMTNHGDRGILSTAPDLARWDAALTSGRLLTPTSLEAMWTPVVLNDGTSFGYGLGWFVEELNGHRHVYHPGGAPGSASIISRYPDDRLTVILLANGGAAYPQALDLGVAQRYAPSLVSREVVALGPGLLESYTGYYNAFGSQVLRVTREKEALVLDDGGRLAGAFLPLSDTRFVAEDADRGFVLDRGVNGEPTGMALRLGSDEMPVQRIGPLPRSVDPQPDPDPAFTQGVEAVLRAFERGGAAVEEVPGVAPQARTDYARGPSPELAGIERISFVGSQDVSGRGIERHGAAVSRVLYYRLLGGGPSRYVIVYLTPDGLVTDQDVMEE